MEEGQPKLPADLHEHPAVAAWLQLQPESIPQQIRVMKRSVCLLKDIGPSSSTIIAKLLPKDSAQIQRTVYEQILPKLPIRTLGYYGSVQATENEWCWIFLEDAAGVSYARLDDKHREIAARWLAQLHTSASELPLTSLLPDRGSNYYLEHLRKGRETIRAALEKFVSRPLQKEVLEKIIAHQDFLESRWNQIERFCARVPGTLVHNDLQLKNVRVRENGTETALMVYDWELAGYGIPATDVALLMPQEPASDLPLKTYWSQVHYAWPMLILEDIEQLVKVGKIFRFLMSTHWESEGLVHNRSRAMRTLIKFQERFEHFYRSAFE